MIPLNSPAIAFVQSFLFASNNSIPSESPCHGDIPCVNTTAGLLRGFSPHPDVHAYVGIRYAEPPIGRQRFEPPVPYTHQPPYPNDPWHEDNIVDAFSPFPSCMQLRGYTPLAEKAAGYPESEDCLSLSIWKPAKPKHEGLMPVIIWVYGGGHAEGGTSQNDGVAVVAETQDVVFAAMNYRLNIFGYPFMNMTTDETTDGRQEISQPNAGELDQRLAVEWIRDNVASFGGDPDRMILVGESAGSTSVTLWAYKYPEDPIVTGLVAMSGQAEAANPADGKAWTHMLQKTGCKDVSCLRQKSARELHFAMDGNNMVFDFLKPSWSSSWMVPDNKTFFPLEEFRRRNERGQIAKIPTLYSSCRNEVDVFLMQPYNTPPINHTMSDLLTAAHFHCPAAQAAATRAAQDIATYRYVFSGIFPELTAYPEHMRAYHSLDVSLWLGSEKHLYYEQPSQSVKDAARYMRKFIRQFAYEPHHGLQSLGWPLYDPNSLSLVDLFSRDDAPFSLINPKEYDAVCEELTI